MGSPLVCPAGGVPFSPEMVQALDKCSVALMNPGLVKPAASGRDLSWARPRLPDPDPPVAEQQQVLEPDSVDDIAGYENQFESGLLFWRHMDSPGGRAFYKVSPDLYRKPITERGSFYTMNRTRLNSYHVRFSLEGDPDMKEFFHALLWEIDQDYPLSPMLKPTEQVQRCRKCKGFYWEQTVLEPKDLKKLAGQIGLRCTDQMWKAAKNCKGELEPVPFGRLQLGAL